MSSMSRRTFIISSAAAMTAASSLRAAGANERIGVGVIGCGSMGRGDVRMLYKAGDVDVRAICDPDSFQSDRLVEELDAATGKKPEVFTDFRRVVERDDIDIVLIATPDHWHALPTIAACEAGKDVYVEKPFANSIAESRAMVEAARKHGRVIQMGSQWRSASHVCDAVEFVRSGKLGMIRLVRAWNYQPTRADSPNFVPEGEAPATADYDLWLGPAPKVPYTKNRFHRSWRYFWDYGGGNASDNGVHLIGVCLMAMEKQAPLRASSSGGKYVYDDDTETPDTQITVTTFPDYTLIWEHAQKHGLGFQGASIGMEWVGANGTVTIDDRSWRAVPDPAGAGFEPAQGEPDKGDPRVTHGKNFLACVASRQQPTYNPEEAHHVTTVSHLGNLAYRTQAEVAWDAENERITNNPAAAALITPPYRAPWVLGG